MIDSVYGSTYSHVNVSTKDMLHYFISE